MTIDREALRRIHFRRKDDQECVGCGDIMEDPCTIIVLLDELEAAELDKNRERDAAERNAERLHFQQMRLSEVEATAERRRALLEKVTQLQTLGGQYTFCMECHYEAAPGRPPHAPDCGLAAELAGKEVK